MVSDSLRLHRVRVPLLEHMLTTSISLPMEMLAAATMYSRMEQKKTSIDVQLCSNNGTPVLSHGNILLTPSMDLSSSSKADLVLLPALWRNPMPIVRRSRETIDWIREQYSHGATFCVAGTGVALMAESGLLDHQPATTHWYYLNRLRKHYPEVLFKPHHLITRAGRIYCAGSVNSVADLMVHIIKLAMGRDIANRVAQQFSHEIRRPFEQTHYADDHTTSHGDEIIVNLQDWLRQHLNDDIDSQHMLAVTGLTQRTLNRRFREATGMSPFQYLQQLRLNHCAELLKATDLSITEIALQSGFNDPDYFSRQFKQHYQLNPSDFRRSVRGKLFYLDTQ
ncbi:helix-turn-helix domain-containing protein [Endozoicomonas gorgoniicola]|uniref:Helix-turn-helix domain-containing protein n=1 Tax=Endozoicomonas gorgoniicola TaxID=1234144 RepID=A0ABT3MSK6_9GAMM|nr:helix-turn-helix domain-containing protein [Endozoicomonas gorgoniicola]MCW7552366.1 helix-turn-helix domain-containing protein [Endozoicomonas gorgoniicola]